MTTNQLNLNRCASKFFPRIQSHTGLVTRVARFIVTVAQLVRGTRCKSVARLRQASQMPTFGIVAGSNPARDALVGTASHRTFPTDKAGLEALSFAPLPVSVSIGEVGIKVVGYLYDPRSNMKRNGTRASFSGNWAARLVGIHECGPVKKPESDHAQSTARGCAFISNQEDDCGNDASVEGFRRSRAGSRLRLRRKCGM